MQCHYGDIAQLARVRDWQSRGQGFDSPYLHVKAKTINLRQEVFCFNHLKEHPEKFFAKHYMPINNPQKLCRVYIARHVSFTSTKAP